MKPIHEYTTDQLITELRNREEGYFVTVIPKWYAIDRLGEENTETYSQEIQERFMESEWIDDCFIDIIDSIKKDLAVSE
jgi:hypothetical protein